MEGGGKREQSRKTTTRAGVSTSILLATVDPSGAGSVPRKREREEWRRIDQLDGKYLRRVTSGVSAAWRSKSRGKTLTTWVRREKKREVEER